MSLEPIETMLCGPIAEKIEGDETFTMRIINHVPNPHSRIVLSYEELKSRSLYPFTTRAMTRWVCPVSVAIFCMEGYFHTITWGER